MKNFFVFLLGVLLFIGIGFGFPYLVQFKWHFFGATFVTMKDIGTLWVSSIFIGVIVASIVFILFIDQKRK